MSKNTQGFMGVQIGKLGPAVGYIYRGQQAYRAYTKDIRNPRTEKQVISRLRFSELSRLSRAYAPAIALGLGRYARQRGGYYRPTFVKLNWDAVTANTRGEINVEYSALILATGSTVNVEYGAPSFGTPATVEVTFRPNSDTPGALDTDLVYIVAYNPGTGIAIASNGAPRTSGTASLTVPTNWSGEQVHVYAFVRNSLTEPTWNEAIQTTVEPGIASDTVYLGEGTIG